GYWQIVLNEFLPNPSGTNPDYGYDFGEDSDSQPQGEWIEIYNKSNKAIDLANWYLKDAEGQMVAIQASNTLSGSTIIGAQGSGSEWLVVFLNGCILDNDGDTVILYDNNGIQVDSYTYTLPENNINNTPGWTNNLVAYLPFDGDFQDLSGNNNHGTNYGATFTSGRINQGLSFDGIDDYVDIGNDTSLNSLNDLTLEAWVNINSYPSVRGNIIGKYLSPAPYRSYETYIDNNGFAVFRIGIDGGSLQYVRSTTTLSLGQWYHIVGTYDGSYIKIYVNGALEGSKAVLGNIKYDSLHVNIGMVKENDSHFNGLIDEVKIYNRALGASEILDHYNAATPSGIVPEYKSYARIPDGVGPWYDPIPTPGQPNKLLLVEEFTENDSIVDSQSEEEISNEPIQEAQEEPLMEEAAPSFVSDDDLTESLLEENEGVEIQEELPQEVIEEEVLEEGTNEQTAQIEEQQEEAVSDEDMPEESITEEEQITEEEITVENPVEEMLTETENVDEIVDDQNDQVVEELPEESALEETITTDESVVEEETTPITEEPLDSQEEPIVPEETDIQEEVIIQEEQVDVSIEEPVIDPGENPSVPESEEGTNE
ncbi:lamin tail domain-containing protein, partial [bacterium]|nr:lamin tail domain-containing protein [bacterium]